MCHFAWHSQWDASSWEGTRPQASTIVSTSYCCLLQLMRSICPFLGHTLAPSWVIFPRRREPPAHSSLPCPRGAMCTWCWPGNGLWVITDSIGMVVTAEPFHVYVHVIIRGSRGSSRTSRLRFGFQTVSSLSAEELLT